MTCLMDLNFNVKSFADDISLFSLVKNKEERTSDLTSDLDMVSKWAYSWKMSFSVFKFNVIQCH